MSIEEWKFCKFDRRISELDTDIFRVMRTPMVRVPMNEGSEVFKSNLLTLCEQSNAPKVEFLYWQGLDLPSIKTACCAADDGTITEFQADERRKETKSRTDLPA